MNTFDSESVHFIKLGHTGRTITRLHLGTDGRMRNTRSMIRNNIGGNKKSTFYKRTVRLFYLSPYLKVESSLDNFLEYLLYRNSCSYYPHKLNEYIPSVRSFSIAVRVSIPNPDELRQRVED